MTEKDARHIDISDVPVLVKLVEDVRSTNRPMILQRGDEELAIVIPRRGHQMSHLPALADPEDVWAGYDPARVTQALAASAGALQDLDRDTFLADLREQGQQDSGGRPFEA